jgi:hypothetical protein
MNEEKPLRTVSPKMLAAGLVFIILIALVLSFRLGGKAENDDSSAFKVVEGTLSEEGQQIECIADTNFTIRPEKGAVLLVTPNGEEWRTVKIDSEGRICRDGTRVFGLGDMYYFWVRSDAANVGKKFSVRFTRPYVKRPEYKGPPQRCPF